jgi:polysaccharide biosynthesis protein PslG
MHRSLNRATARAAAVVLLIAALFVGVPRTPEAQALFAPADGYGFGVGAAMTWMSTVEADRELDAVARTGASWFRALIDWNLIEPMPGAFDWGYIDYWVNGALSRGLRVLGVIAYTPEWARQPGTDFTGPPVDPAVFASFATKVVERYGDRVSSWEIWNEPNVPWFFGNSDNRAAEYTQLLKAAYPAIKAVQPNGTVVSAGLSPALEPDWSPPAFVNGMYASGAKGYFDAMAMHPYVFPHGLAVDVHNGWSDVELVRQIMIDNQDGTKKIWMTEIGAPTSAPQTAGVSQLEQAREITDVLWKASQSGYSGPAIIYSIRDLNTANPDSDQDNFGALLTTDWQPKLASIVLAR